MRNKSTRWHEETAHAAAVHSGAQHCTNSKNSRTAEIFKQQHTGGCGEAGNSQLAPHRLFMSSQSASFACFNWTCDIATAAQQHGTTVCVYVLCVDFLLCPALFEEWHCNTTDLHMNSKFQSDTKLGYVSIGSTAAFDPPASLLLGRRLSAVAGQFVDSICVLSDTRWEGFCIFRQLCSGTCIVF